MVKQTKTEFILHQGWADFQELWLIRHEFDKAYNGYLEKGSLKWEEVKDTADTSKLTPFMKVSRNFPIQEMVDALTDTKKATEQVETFSELKATKYHLEDMRKLLKLI